QSRVLLFGAQERNALIAKLSKARWLPLCNQHLVQGRVNGIERTADRDVDDAAAIGSRVASFERELRKEACAGFGKCFGRFLDFQMLALQGEVGAQSLSHIIR